MQNETIRMLYCLTCLFLMSQLSYGQKFKTLEESLIPMIDQCALLNVAHRSLEYQTNAAVLRRDNLPEMVTSMSEEVCQTFIFWTDNIDTTNLLTLLGQYRIKTSLTIVTSNETLYETVRVMKKITFDMNAILINDQITIMSKYKYVVKKDTNWRSVKVTFSPMSPYVMIDKQGGIFGADVVFWNIMADNLNLKLEFVKETSFNGMFEQVANGQADAIMAQAAMSGGNRYHLADVSHPMFTRTFRFFNRIPDKVTPMMTLAYPFQAAVWRFLVLAVFLIFVTVSLFSLVHSGEIGTLTYHDAFLISISPILGDAMPNHWKGFRSSWYGYAFLFIWLLGGLLLSLSYSSNLLANLISVQSKTADDTFEDLINNGRTLVLLENTALTPIMKTSPKPIIKQCYQECLIEKNGYYKTYGNHPEHITRMLMDGTASELIPSLQIYGRRHLFRLGKEVLIMMFTGYHFRWNHPLKLDMERQISGMAEAGITYHIRERYLWQKSKPERVHERNNPGLNADNIKIGLSHLTTLWIILGIGHSLAVIGILKEVFFIRKKHVQ